MNSTEEKLILIADCQDGVNTVSNILGTDIKIISSNSLKESISFLEKNIIIIICGVHFDECRMFEFLKKTKSTLATQNIPFLCFRDYDRYSNLATFTTLHFACEALGASGFVDLYELKARLGKRQAEIKFKSIVCNIISTNSN